MHQPKAGDAAEARFVKVPTFLGHLADDSLGFGFQADFLASLLGAVIVTIVNMVLSAIFKDELKPSHS